eukprot:TRINITY_DN1049_c0_g1_i1.p1 TRINITY_DN1049_c0_g1~~TRINITY_DN1049_c0_g1_i1.p1  ORF type:complete len:251 (-),score=79.42 TRINITY_DN1049_c0_g1_i1:138-890(-)
MLRRLASSLRPAQARGLMRFERTLTAEDLNKKYGIGAVNMDYTDLYSKHLQLVTIKDEMEAKLAPDAFIAPCATLAGNVEVWDYASVWYGSVLRGDNRLVRIGAYTNIQDRCVITEAPRPLRADHDGSTIVGHYCTVGHGAHLHACTVEEESHIGMGCVLMEGSYVERQSMLGACSVLLPNQRVPAGQLWVGNPAKYVRDLTDSEKLRIVESAEHYHQVAKEHMDEFFLPVPMGAVREAQEAGYKIGFQT